MTNEKSIEYLINSIYNLVNEAKKEQENILEVNRVFNNRNLTKQDILPRQSEKTDSVKTSSLTNDATKNNDIIIESEEKNNRINDKSKNWKNINFSSNLKKIEEIYTNQVPSVETDLRFKELLSKWVDSNLKRIIETEFSNYVKNIKS